MRDLFLFRDTMMPKMIYHMHMLFHLDVDHFDSLEVKLCRDPGPAESHRQIPTQADPGVETSRHIPTGRTLRVQS